VVLSDGTSSRTGTCRLALVGESVSHGPYSLGWAHGLLVELERSSYRMSRGDHNARLQLVLPLFRNTVDEKAYSTGFQVSSGLNALTALAASVVFSPRFFWNTTPSWLTKNDITPELPYSAG
jgi:hypothetical protein